MNKEKKLGFIIGTILIISALSFVYADEYKIDEAFLNLTIKDNGLLHLDEQYNYNFVGTYNGITRDIPLKNGESISNLNITTDGAYCTYTNTTEDGVLKLKIYLYSDPQHQHQIENTNVKVHISYDMANVVTIYKDTVSLQYKIWGDNWDVPVGKLTTNINLPGSNGNMYWINPPQYNLTSSMSGNTIHSESTEIPKERFYELQLLMPTSDFHDANYAKHEDRDAKDDIIEIQNKYKEDQIFYSNLFLYLGCLFAISPLTLGLIYLKYGREPKISYEGLYEREIPTKDPPAKVNALIDGKGGQTPNIKGYEATIMDLINRKVIKLEVEGKEEKTLILNFEKTRTDDLDSAEKILIQNLKSFAIDDKLNLNEFESQLRIESNAEYFRQHYDLWEKECETQYLDYTELEKYINTDGANLGRFFGIIEVILGIILFILTFQSTTENANIGMIGSIIIFITGIVSFMLPNDVLGHWSEYGKEYHDKWTNFKKFLTDNSLINEHPPESIIIWNQYLVYGTALGVADNVYKSMKIHVPSETMDSDLYLFHTYGGYYIMHDALYHGMDSGISDASSGLGDIGGGSGGGGGGAF